MSLSQSYDITRSTDTTEPGVAVVGDDTLSNVAVCPYTGVNAINAAAKTDKMIIFVTFMT